MGKTIIICVFIFSSLINAYGCSCHNSPFEQASEWADEIFIGRVIEIREVNSQDYIMHGTYTRIWAALFEVEKKWKGSKAKYVEVFQPNSSCDFYFSLPSRPYLVYAKDIDLLAWDETQSFYGLSTWLCARNTETFNYSANAEYVDDRNNLDEKYPLPIKLIGFNFKSNWTKLIFVISLIGIFFAARLFSFHRLFYSVDF